MKKSITEKEFLVQFINDKTNRWTFKFLGKILLPSPFVVWFFLGRPAFPPNDWGIPVGLFLFLVLISPFLLFSRWGDVTNSETKEERIRKGNMFWGDPYNLYLFNNIFAFISLSLIIVLVFPDQPFGFRAYLVFLHLFAYAVLIIFDWEHFKNLLLGNYNKNSSENEEK